MPRLSPDGRRILSGVGGSRIRVDGAIPVGLEALTAGDWAWVDDDVITGNGSPDGNTWGLWRYRLSSAALEHVDPRGASFTYAGGGAWIVYLASHPFVSYASTGQSWADRVARGCSPAGQYVWTSHEADMLYWGAEVHLGVEVASIQAGPGGIVLWWDPHRGFQTIGAGVPLAPASGGMGARFTIRGGQAWICQWVGALGGVAVYPWQGAGRLDGYVLSTDEHDFNHDIGVQPDGALVVVTGTDQGETATRRYELAIEAGQVRVNGGPWKALVHMPMSPGAATDPAVPPSTPIVSVPGYKVPVQASYGRKGYTGPYFATDLRAGNFATPGNTEMIVNGTVIVGNQQVQRPVFVSLPSTGNPADRIVGFLAGANDSSMGNAGIVACWQWHKAHYPRSELVRYSDTATIGQEFINACEREAIVQVQCYPQAGEGPAASIARFAASLDRVIASGRRAGVARALNTKFAGLQAVLSIQDGLCSLVRSRPAVVLDAWFSHGRWYAGVESGAAYCAELLAWEPVLGGLFTGVP